MSRRPLSPSSKSIGVRLALSTVVLEVSADLEIRHAALTAAVHREPIQ
jgi:hypothetical protein